MAKGYITIKIDSKQSTEQFIRNSVEDIYNLFAAKGYSIDISSGVVEVEKEKEETGIVSQFWIDFLAGGSLNPAFAAKDNEAVGEY